MSDMDRHARAALRKELQRAEENRASLDVVIRYLRERLGESPPDATSNAPGTRPQEANPSAESKPKGKRITAAVAAHQVLELRGTPMRTPEILPAIQLLGVSIKDVDGLYRAMTRDPRFVKEGRGLWGLKAWRERGTLDLNGQPPAMAGRLV